MKNTKLLPVLITALFMITAVLQSFAQKSIELKYVLKQGDVYNYVMDTDQDIVFETNGQTMALSNIMTFTMEQKVAEVSSDSIKLDGQIKRVQSTQAIFGMEVKYDSDDPSSAENPMVAKMAEEFVKILDKSFYMSMDHKGNMGNMDLSGVTDSEDVANNLNSGSQFASYPEGKVKVGESWEKEINPAEASDMMLTATYTLLKISGKTALLGIKGKITANKFADSDMKMDGTMSGEMLVDAKTGWLIESTLDQEIELDIEQNGMRFPASISGTITTTSEKQ